MDSTRKRGRPPGKGKITVLNEAAWAIIFYKLIQPHYMGIPGVCLDTSKIETSKIGLTTNRFTKKQQYKEMAHYFNETVKNLETDQGKELTHEYCEQLVNKLETNQQRISKKGLSREGAITKMTQSTLYDLAKEVYGGHLHPKEESLFKTQPQSLSYRRIEQIIDKVSARLKTLRKQNPSK